MTSAIVRLNSIPFFRSSRSRSQERSAQTTLPATAQDVPATLTVTRTDLPDGMTTLLTLAGEFGPRTYLQPLAVAQAAYADGRTRLVVDLGAIERISLSSFFTLHAMACLFAGRPVPEAELGVNGLRSAIEAGEGQAPAPLRLVQVSPAVARSLAASAGSALLPICADVATACAELASGVRTPDFGMDG